MVCKKELMSLLLLQQIGQTKIYGALLRPGHFDRLLYVGPPDETDREEIFRIHLANMKCSHIDRRDLACQTEGYTGADIRLICREAGLAAIEESLSLKESLDALEIKMQHLETAIRQVKPTKTHFYQELSGKFQRNGMDVRYKFRLHKSVNQSQHWSLLSKLL